MSDKLSYMKRPLQRVSEFLKPSRYLKQPEFEDKLLKSGPKFAHSWANMCQMHDLRVWTITYAPGRKDNMQRLSEIHMLN